jgi:tungstate transport system substrate-binding protein
MGRSNAARCTPALLAVAALLLASGCAGHPPSLRIATTTSVDNSGLLEGILPAFERESGVNLQVIATGSGQAINLGRRGDVALIVTHEPIGERALFDDGLVRYYRKVMYNRFVIAGPAADPAGVAGAASAREAMTRIARHGALFISRGDESGTHVRERQLWTEAGTTPTARALVETGQGMSPTLRVASQRQAYVLTDEATLAQLAPALSISALYAGDPVLMNTYAVSVLTTVRASSAETALTFARWLAEGAGQRHLDAFRIHGRQVFFAWPASADARTPESLPAGAH